MIFLGKTVDVKIITNAELSLSISDFIMTERDM